MIPRPCGFALRMISRARDLLEVDHLLGRRGVAAAELGRPARHEPTRVEQRALPRRAPTAACPRSTASARSAAPPTAGARRATRRARRGTLRPRVRTAGASMAQGSFRPPWTSSSPPSRRCCARRCARSSPTRRRSRRCGPRTSPTRSTRRCGRGWPTSGVLDLGDGRRGGRARGARARGVPGAVRLVGDRRALVASPASTTDRHARGVRGGHAVPVGVAGDRASRPGAGSTETKVHVADAARPPSCSSSPHATTTAASACSSTADAIGRAVAHGRRVAQAGPSGVRGRAAPHGSTRRGGRCAHARSTGSASRTSSTASAPRNARSSSRSSTRRNGCSSASRSARSRPCSTCAPTCCARSSSAAPPAYYACWALDDAPPEEAHRAATLAQAFAADAFPQLGGTAIQVFGGIGFTWEHDIHLYYKRLLTLRPSPSAPPTDHLEALANIALH